MPSGGMPTRAASTASGVRGERVGGAARRRRRAAVARGGSGQQGWRPAERELAAPCHATRGHHDTKGTVNTHLCSRLADIRSVNVTADTISDKSSYPPGKRSQPGTLSYPYPYKQRTVKCI